MSPSDDAELEALRITLRCVGVAVITVDGAGLVTGLNAAAEGLVGCSAAEVRGQVLPTVLRLKHEVTGAPLALPGDPDPLGGRVELAPGAVVVGRDGAEHLVAGCCSPLFSRDGQHRGRVIALRDRSGAQAAEAALADSEARFQAFFDHAPIGKSMTAVDGRLLRVNPALSRMLGYSIEELATLRWAEITHPDDVPASAECVRCLLAGEQDTYHLDKRYRAKDGREVHTHVTTRLHRDARGAPQFFLTHIEDVTELRRAEARARLDQARLQALLDLTQTPVAGAQELLDLALHQALALTGSVLGYIYHYHEDRREFVLNSWSRGVMSACAVTDPQSVYALDRTGLWGEAVRQRRPILVNDYPAPDPLKKGYPEGHVALERFLTVPVLDGEAIVAVVGVANKPTDYDETDVAQLTLMMSSVWRILRRREVELQLAESERRARSQYEHLPVPTYLYRRQGEAFELADLNQAAADEAPDRSAGWIGASPRAVHGALPELEQALETCRLTQEVLRGSLRQVAACGRPERYLSYTCGPLGPDAVLLHLEDVTRERRVEEQLRAGQRLEAVGRLAGGVAHDFNNLLTVIGSNVGFALADLHPGDPLWEDLNEVRKASDRAASLTRQLLAFSRRQILEPVVVDLPGVVAGLVGMLRRLIGEDIHLVVQAPPDPVRTRVDPGQLEQVIMNLVVNARDAMPHGGALTLEVSEATVDASFTDRHPDARPGAYALLTVSDTGEGMDEATRARIFEPFFTTKRVGEGTGLGLATVYGVVKQSGGFVWVYSEPDQGSVFKVYLPLAATGPATAGRPTPVELVRGGTETVLVVEDEDAVRRLARRILVGLGYQVIAAPNGGEALLRCEQHPGPIHLLLTDVVMPLMSGRQLAERLLQVRPGLRVLYMSGYTDDAIVHHGVLDAGAQFIGKPFTPDGLGRKVRLVLDT